MPSGASISSAMPARTRTSGSDVGLSRTLPNERTRPSQFTKVPDLSVDRRDREDHVGELGDGGVAHLEGDHEAAFSTPCGELLVGARRPGRHRRRPGRRARRRQRGQDRVAVTTARPRAGARRPRRSARSTRADASATGRPPGSRFGRAPASTAPRSPARRGTQASRAPVVIASFETADERTGHGGEPLADQDQAAAVEGDACRRGPGPRSPPARHRDASGAACRRLLLQAARVNGAIE